MVRTYPTNNIGGSSVVTTLFIGSSSNYLTYNAGTSKVELWVAGVKSAEWA